MALITGPLPFPAQGLYAITPDLEWPPDVLAEQVGRAIAGGARVIQHRCKNPDKRFVEAEALVPICRSAGVPLIINDDVDLALDLGADGVHLGKDDAGLMKARKKTGPGFIIGISCYDSIDRALSAQAQGASYVAFGRFFPSRTKPTAPLAHLETLHEARQRLLVPIVAIGGITPDNGRVLLEAGAAVLAVIEGIFGEADVEQAARRFQPLFASE